MVTTSLATCLLQMTLMAGLHGCCKQAFNHSDKDVYDDPIFTVSFETTKADQYWKIIPKKNVDAGRPLGCQVL